MSKSTSDKQAPSSWRLPFDKSNIDLIDQQKAEFIYKEARLHHEFHLSCYDKISEHRNQTIGFLLILVSSLIAFGSTQWAENKSVAISLGLTASYIGLQLYQIVWNDLKTNTVHAVGRCPRDIAYPELMKNPMEIILLSEVELMQDLSEDIAFLNKHRSALLEVAIRNTCLAPIMTLISFILLSVF